MEVNKINKFSNKNKALKTLRSYAQRHEVGWKIKTNRRADTKWKEKHSELYKNSLVSPGLASCTSWSCEGKGENDINGLSTNFILWLEREKEKYLLDDLPNGSVGDIIRLQLTCKSQISKEVGTELQTSHDITSQALTEKTDNTLPSIVLDSASEPVNLKNRLTNATHLLQPSYKLYAKSSSPVPKTRNDDGANLKKIGSYADNAIRAANVRDTTNNATIDTTNDTSNLSVTGDNSNPLSFY
ncbi:hypothetical protein EB796_002393 [Bugula neritina]|uniref:Uncharacterized protein n=1 Tax=Bugula neritina TaxID=10212 RepID=A0A7J7KMB1_BUGNE|nr:hypothetical protein EB796_002393 [Bugula neritina]